MRLVIAATLVILAAACQRETADVSQNDPSKSSTAGSAAHQSPPPSNQLNPVIPTEKDERASSPTPAVATQEVHLIEYAIHMPGTLEAGKVAFNIENGGKEDHAFEVEGNGIEKQSAILKRGGTTSLEVDLKPGTYTVYCPVKDHAQRGMKTTITVR